MPSVMVQCEVHRVQTDQPLRYRVWVGNELFAERGWHWGSEHFLQEHIGIAAPAGDHWVRVEAIQGQLQVCNWDVVQGPGQIDQQGQLRIQHENT